MASRWRREADRIIAETLAALPADASISDKRKALFQAYPFGLREHTPYKHWCAAQREALKVPAPKVDPGATFVLQRWRRPFWLAVQCGMCEGKIDGGCLQCVRLHEKLLEVVDRPHWRGFQLDPTGDVGIALDWLDEQGVTPLKVEMPPEEPKRKARR